ncbi:MAG: GTP-binding protein [Methanolobus sp.]
MDFGPELSMGPIVGLIDGSKFKELMNHSEGAITKQVENADMILLNKKDMLTSHQLAEFETTIKDINPNAAFLQQLLNG